MEQAEYLSQMQVLSKPMERLTVDWRINSNR